MLFYQFDLERFSETRGAYLDLSTDLFGPVAYDAESAVALLKGYVESGFASPEYQAKMEDWKARAFAYHDAGNCERTMDAILDCCRRSIS